MSKLSDWSEGIANAQNDRSSRLKGMSGWIRFLGWLNNELNPKHDWFDYESMSNNYQNVKNQVTKSDLTGAEKAANQFTADEAQKQRDWETEKCQYGFSTPGCDMRAAGVNPALAMNGSSGASTPSGASASSVSPGASILSSPISCRPFFFPCRRSL